MGSTSRTETFLHRGRLIPVSVCRASGRGIWPSTSAYPANELVAVVEGKLGNVRIVERGDLATDSLIEESILLHRGRDPSQFDLQLWSQIPTSLTEALRARVARAVKNVADSWYQFSNEETCTGAVFSQLIGVATAEDGWRAEIEFVEFSKQKKEPETGADLALLLDILGRDGRRAIKTIWLQAKRAFEAPASWKDLPRLEDQMAKMRKFSQASFGLVYTPNGALVVGPSVPPQASTLENLVEAGLKCVVGDQCTKVYAQSLDRLRTATVFLTQS